MNTSQSSATEQLAAVEVPVTKRTGAERQYELTPAGAPLVQLPTLATATNTNPVPLAEPNVPKPRFKRRRWGTIQRLSPRTRLWINNALRDGLTNKQIMAGLSQRRCTNISPKQLRDWSRTGYIDWLRDQQAFEKIVLTTDRAYSEKTPTAKNKNFRSVSELDLAVQLHTAARQFNLEKFCQHLEAKPEVFLRLVQANALHERNAILRDCHELEQKKFAAKTRKPKCATFKRGGVTPEELERLTRRINL